MSDTVRLELEDRESSVGLRLLGGPRRQRVQCGDLGWARKVPPHRHAAEGAAAAATGALSLENPRELCRRRRRRRRRRWGFTVAVVDGRGNVEEGEDDERGAEQARRRHQHSTIHNSTRQSAERSTDRGGEEGGPKSMMAKGRRGGRPSVRARAGGLMEPERSTKRDAAELTTLHRVTRFLVKDS